MLYQDMDQYLLAERWVPERHAKYEIGFLFPQRLGQETPVHSRELAKIQERRRCAATSSTNALTFSGVISSPRALLSAKCASEDGKKW